MLGQFGDVKKEGWLEKQSKFLKSWRKRWFVLTDTHLYTFKQQQVYNNPTEQLVLKNCTTVKSADMGNKPNTFRIDSPDRVFFVRAATMQEKEMWIGAIGIIIITIILIYQGKALIQPNIQPQSGSEDEEESITDEDGF